MEFYKRISFGVQDDPIEHIYRSLSGAMAINLGRTKITPNQVTIFRIFIVAGILYLFYLGTHLGYLLGAILIVINHILDYVDGDLARVKNQMSKTGEWLESLLDGPFGYIHTIPGFFLGLSIYRTTGRVEVWVLLFISLLGVHLNDVFSKYFVVKNQDVLINSFQEEYDTMKEKLFIAKVFPALLRHTYLFILLFAILYNPLYDFFNIHPILIGILVTAVFNQVMWLTRLWVQFKYVFIINKMKI